MALSAFARMLIFIKFGAITVTYKPHVSVSSSFIQHDKNAKPAGERQCRTWHRALKVALPSLPSPYTHPTLVKGATRESNVALRKFTEI